MSTIYQKLELIQADVAAVCSQNQVISINSDTDLEAAIETEISVKKRIKRIEELRTFFVKPLNDQVRSINDMFKNQSSPLIELEVRIKAARRVYALMQEEEANKKRLAELEAAKETMGHAEAEIAAIVSVPVPAESVKLDSGTGSIKKVWTFEVEDEKKLRKYYPQLFVLDTQALRALITGGKREIAGVRVYQDLQPVTRIR